MIIWAFLFIAGVSKKIGINKVDLKNGDFFKKMKKSVDNIWRG